MAYDFNIDEILGIAEQIEKNGAKFYRTAAERISGSPNKNLLLKLSKMEEEHEKTFGSWRTELSDQEKEPTVFDPDGDLPKYLKALADTRVFFEKDIDVTSLKEILKEAISTEKDSIVFYIGMKELVPEKLGKDKIETIIKEEMDHIRVLANKLRDLKP